MFLFPVGLQSAATRFYFPPFFTQEIFLILQAKWGFAAEAVFVSFGWEMVGFGRIRV